MKRLLALILCLAMLACVLVSCRGDAPAQTPSETEAATPPIENDTDGDNNRNHQKNPIRLKEYTIIYPKRAAAMVKDAAEDLAATIQLLLEDEVKISSDEEAATAAADAKEILIGSTNRGESRAYYSATPDFRYNIYQRKNKIVLAGYSDALTAEAVAYFIETYVSTSEEGVIENVEDYTGQWSDMITLTRGGTSDFRIVRQRSEVESLGLKYLTNVINTLVETLKEKTGTTIPTFYSDGVYRAEAKEIMLGRYPHVQLNGQYDAMQLGGYTISVLENKLLIAATSEASYADAILALDKILEAHKLYGSRDIALPIGLKESNEGLAFFKNLPLPKTSLKKFIKAGDDSQVVIFANASPTIFNNYGTALKNAGYTEYTRTNFDGSTAATKNYFATYVSDDRTIDVAFHEYDDLMYVSVSPKGKLTLPTTTAPTYTPVNSQQYPVTLTQIGTADLHSESDMCYVIRLADGSFIVYDTGLSYTNRGYVGDEIYKVLCKQAVDKNNIVISAFILTHPHLDHMQGFTQFADRYASNTAIKVKQVVYNFPEPSFLSSTEKRNAVAVNTAVKQFRGNVEIVKPRSGNVLYYPGVKFNVVYTQEDYLSLAKNFSGSSEGNASCLVTQMVTADGTKVLFGADHWVSKCNYQLPNRYGFFLNSYIVTVFHHGLGGGADDEGRIYAMSKAKIVLWPNTWRHIKTAGSVPLMDCPRNHYFTTGKQGTGEPGTGGFESGKIHDMPNANGVLGWFVSENGIQIVTFNSKDNVSVFTYPTRADYFNS